MYRSIFVLAVLGAATTLAQPADEARTPTCGCGPNQHFEASSNACQISCDNMHLEPVMGACVPTDACFCDAGYVRNKEGICIKRVKCPKPSPVCGLNEVSTVCYNDCQTTCKNRFVSDGKVCTLACTRTGCICKPDYYRHDNGTCVPSYECSPANCNKGEQYTTCGSACPATCQNRGDTCTACTFQCVEGCFCAGNKIRAPDGTCVEPKNCPKRTCSGKDEVFVQCPPTCPETEECKNIWSRFACEGPNPSCCKPSCRCKSGFYRNDQNVCISSAKCQENQSNGAQPVAVSAAAGPDATAEATV